MNVNGVNVVCFSPTGSSRRIAEAVAGGMGSGYQVMDMTLPSARRQYHHEMNGNLTVLAAPVYFGRVAAPAADVFAGLKGGGAPAVLLAVYGNRHYDDALVEMQDIAVAGGFTPVAAAAFIAAHSFDAPEHPIAPGRPDGDDLAKARMFGTTVAAKVQIAAGVDHMGAISLPGSRPYREYGSFPVAPDSDETCRSCGTCASVCPQGAIQLGERGMETNAASCIFCHACVKACPAAARSCQAEPAQSAYKRLSSLLKVRRGPEMFL